MKVMFRFIVGLLLGGILVFNSIDSCICYAADSVGVLPQDRNINNEYVVSISEDEYKTLEKRFGKDIVESMGEEQANAALNDPKFKTISYVEKYYIEEQKLIDGKYISVERECTLKEVFDLINTPRITLNSVVNGKKSEVVTSAKKLTISTGAGAISGYKHTIVRCDWLTMPSKRTYDLIGIRLGEYSKSLEIYKNSVIGKQCWDNNIITYDRYSDNTKIVENGFKQGVSGVGISMNIKDDVKKSLWCSLDVTYSVGKEQWTTYGSYQHAIKTISDSNKKKYSFSAGGAGNVFKLDNCISDSFDYMSGVYATNFTD